LFINWISAALDFHERYRAGLALSGRMREADNILDQCRQLSRARIIRREDADDKDR
jgi:hypothetical protein